MDDEGLIAAIRAAPDDDLPRLAWADWLDEHGDPARAEFVRLQCWLSAHPASTAGWDDRWSREQRLLTEHAGGWAVPLRDYLRSGGWDRGFPTWLYAADVQEFTWVAGELMRMLATDRLCCSALDDDSAALMAGCPAVADIRELVTNWDVGGLGPVGLRAVVESPYAQNLRRLDLSGATHLSGDADLLAREPVRPHLEHVHLGWDWWRGLEPVLRLLTAPHRRSLCGLEVQFSATEAAALCECPDLARLTHFHLHIGEPSAFTDDVAEALARCPYLDQLRLLVVGDSDVLGTEYSRAIVTERFGDRVVFGRADPYRVVTGRPR